MRIKNLRILSYKLKGSVPDEIKKYMDGKNMSEYNVYRSIIDKNIKKEFKDFDWCPSLNGGGALSEITNIKHFIFYDSWNNRVILEVWQK